MFISWRALLFLDLRATNSACVEKRKREERKKKEVYIPRPSRMLYTYSLSQSFDHLVIILVMLMALSIINITHGLSGVSRALLTLYLVVCFLVASRLCLLHVLYSRLADKSA